MKLKVGDCVMLKPSAGVKGRRMGRIEEINDNIIRYSVLYFPEETKGGRLRHNSVNEVYESDQIEKEAYANVKQLAEVLTLDEYMKRKASSSLSEVFFFRQKYSYEDDSYLPDLDSTCYCDKVFNPDEEYQQCAKCKDYFHMACYIQSRRKKCYNELCNNLIENQFTTFQLEAEKKRLNEEPVKMLGVKHNRDDDNNEEISRVSKKPSSSSSYQEKMYQNLAEPSRINLISLAEQIEKEHLISSKSYNEIDKVRQNAKDTLLFALLYGVEEIKSANDWKKILDSENGLQEDSINDEKAVIKFCEGLSKQIEGFIYSSNKYEIGHQYKKKLRTLYTHLMLEDNSELRLAILSKDISPQKLVGMSSDELAPSSFIQSRLEQQNKYFKEQVLIEETTKVITKTHKGEAILTIEDNIKPSAPVFLPFDVVKPKLPVEEVIDLDLDEEMGESNEQAVKSPRKVQSEESRIESMIAARYKTKSKAKIALLTFLEDFTKANLEKRINDKIKTTLKLETVLALKKIREKNKTTISLI